MWSPCHSNGTSPAMLFTSVLRDAEPPLWGRKGMLSLPGPWRMHTSSPPPCLLEEEMPLTRTGWEWCSEPLPPESASPGVSSCFSRERARGAKPQDLGILTSLLSPTELNPPPKAPHCKGNRGASNWTPVPPMSLAGDQGLSQKYRKREKGLRTTREVSVWLFTTEAVKW